MNLKPSAAAMVLFLVFTVSGCASKGSPTPSPSSASAAATHAIDQQARFFLAQGAVSAVVQLRWPGGEWSNAYGVRILDAKDAAQPGDRVSVASATETFTAVTVFKLVEDHLIGLDDPVNNVIPEFAAVLHPPGPITVRELLSQTSGIPDYVPASLPGVDLRPALAQPLSLEQALRDAGGQPWPARSVGTFQFTQTNYVALGLLVQTLRKKPFADVLDEEVIAPLGLQHTSTAHLDLTQKDILHGYITLHGQRIDLTDNTHFVGSSSGGLISTMGDLNTFLAALFGGRLLSPSLLAEMEARPAPSAYGLGVWKGASGCPGVQRFHLAGIQEHALTVGISSVDGKYTASMTVVPPPLPGTAEDPSADRQRTDMAVQAEAALNDALNALCPAS